jgi:hypothetical protein
MNTETDLKLHGWWRRKKCYQRMWVVVIEHAPLPTRRKKTRKKMLLVVSWSSVENWRGFSRKS